MLSFFVSPLSQREAVFYGINGKKRSESIPSIPSLAITCCGAYAWRFHPSCRCPSHIHFRLTTGKGSDPADQTLRTRIMQSSLTNHFVSPETAASPPKISFASQEIRDRKSAFVAYIVPVKDASQVKDAIAYVRRTHANRPPAHEVTAWRFMTLKPGMTGLGGEDDFEVVSAYDDDGEKWAGGRVLNIMKQTSVMDAVVVVSRWWVHPLNNLAEGGIDPIHCT